MKKLKVFSTLLLLASAGALFAYHGYSKTLQDHKPPVVTCESDTLEVSVEASENDLLQGVSAKDNRSGDVSDTLVVESLSAFTEEGTRIATYAAVDEHKNVGRCERTIKYTDYSLPTFQMTGSLCYSAGEELDILSKIQAQSVLDGDLTTKIKYSLEQAVNTKEAGEYPIEFRVMDSSGQMVYLKTRISVTERSYAGIEVKLNDYLIYIPKGTAFDPAAYFAGSDKEGTLSVESNLDPMTEGTYYVDYIVDGGAVRGKSRLVIVVK